MKKIKIISTPPGSAPEEIRNQWVGVEIPTQDEKDDGGGTFRSGTQNVGGYQVSGEDAVNALKEAGKEEAYEYWLPYSRGTFVFKAECCEEVPVVT